MSDAEQIVYLNGAFLPIGDAKISVLDRGFIFGDGVYEVIPAYGREPFRMPHHLARLAHSCDGIGLANPHADAEWERLVRELVARQPFDDQAVYLQVTRGVAKRDHAFPKGASPTNHGLERPSPMSFPSTTDVWSRKSPATEPDREAAIPIRFRSAFAARISPKSRSWTATSILPTEGTKNFFPSSCGEFRPAISTSPTRSACMPASSCGCPSPCRSRTRGRRNRSRTRSTPCPKA
mgnify:CR=1 FL=1